MEGEVLVKNSVKDEAEFNIDGLMRRGVTSGHQKSKKLPNFSHRRENNVMKTVGEGRQL